MILKGYIISILYVLLCLALAVILYKLGVKKPVTRKVVHILVGFEWVILHHFMGAGSLHFLAVCVLFFVLLLLEYRMKLMPMMSSDGDNAPGTVYYALAMSLLGLITVFVPDMIYPFGIAVFCTSFGDGFAGLVGQSIKRHNPKIWDNKSIVGTLVNFSVSLAVTFVFSGIFDLRLRAWECIAVAVFVTELELFCSKGIDNLAITLGAASLAYSLINFPATVNYIVPILCTPLLIALTYRKKALTLGGIIAAILLDIAVSIAFGNFGFITLLFFFVGSLIADKIKKKAKKQEQKTHGECRSAYQVFANGFLAMLFSLLYILMENRVFILAFVVVLAEAFADTAASGIGALSRRTYDIFRLEKCDNGLSGGVSLVGTFASLVSAIAVSFIPFLFGRVSIYEALIISACAFLGAIFDSFLGSLLQVKYKCKVCSTVVETSTHCGTSAEKYRGLSFINNSAVNFISTVFSSALILLVWYLI